MKTTSIPSHGMTWCSKLVAAHAFTFALSMSISA